MHLKRSMPALAGVALALAALTGATASILPSEGYRTTIAVANPRMGAEAVAELARVQLRRMELAAPARVAIEIVDVNAVPASNIQDVEPRAKVEESPNLAPDRTLWLVHANGPFISFRGLAAGPRTGTSGWFIIDDATGDVVGMSFKIDGR
jgi:hypothetical protein